MFVLIVHCLESSTVYLTLIDCDRGKQYVCGPETVNVSRRETEGNIGSRRFTERTISRASQSICILLYAKCQRRQKETSISPPLRAVAS
jgi:hypothetical protein